MKVNRNIRLDPAQIEHLFYWSWYDGPLDGMILYKGEKLWYTIFAGGNAYLVYRLPPEIIAMAEDAHFKGLGQEMPFFATREQRRKYPLVGIVLSTEM